MSIKSSMRKYQNDFAITFATLMEKKLPQWKRVQVESIVSLYSVGAIIGYIGIGLLGFLPGKNEHNYDLSFHCVMAVICFIVAIISNIHMVNKSYQNKIKSTFFGDLLMVFNKDIKYKSAENQISKEVYKDSKLYDVNKIQIIHDDDIFGGIFNDVAFSINETDFGYEYRTKNGKRYACLFDGVAMLFRLNKAIRSRVLILTKFSGTRIPKGYEKVITEYDKFNKKYDVYAEKINGGQIEARYLLNTAFMDRLMQLQTSFKVGKMCCSVFGNDMLIMLSTGRDLFEMNHLLRRVDDVKQYRNLFDEFASVLSFIEVLNLSSKTKL